MWPQHPPIRMKRVLRPCTTSQERQPGLELHLFYQTRSVSPGPTTLEMKHTSKSSGKKGLQERMPKLKQTQANVTTYTDKDSALKDGTLYYYRVCATNAAGDSAFSNEASGTTPMAKPTAATATAVSSSQINLIWIDNSVSETGYKIERKRTAAGTFAQIAQVGANVQSYHDTGLDHNTRYYYRVRATNGTINSDYSNMPNALTFP